MPQPSKHAANSIAETEFTYRGLRFRDCEFAGGNHAVSILADENGYPDIHRGGYQMYGRGRSREEALMRAVSYANQHSGVSLHLR